MLCIFFILERESSLRDIVSLPLCVSVIIFCSLTMTNWAFLAAQMVKNLPTVRETWVPSLGPIPGSERSPGEGNGNQLPFSSLGNATDRGDWRATVHRVAESQPRLSD